MIELKSIQFENIRNFSNTSVEIDRPKTVFVGRNNSGKTSALSLIDWLFNTLDIDELWEGEDGEHTEACKSTVLPARSTGRKARRITLWVYVSDRRSYNKFSVENGIARLRIRVGSEQNFRLAAKLGAPKKIEGWDSDKNAVELLERLRNNYRVTYVPSFRDASSERFGHTLSGALSGALGERALASGKKGKQPPEYVKVQKVQSELESLARNLTKPVLEQLRDGAPSGLLKAAKLDIQANAESIVDFLVSKMQIKLITGEQDSSSVPTDSVGSGLQSVLDVALHGVRLPGDNRKHILMLEEPEAFLHPSAQRVMARELLTSSNADVLFVTTHSPIVVEEAGYKPLCLVAEQKFYNHNVSKERRLDISTSLLRSGGSEMIFAKSVLLVEGDGDVQFFEAVRRRLTRLDPTGSIDRIFVVEVGGKTRFSPWLQAIKAFDAPTVIQGLVVADTDAATDLITTLEEAGFSKTSQTEKTLTDAKLAEANVLQGASVAEKIARVPTWHEKIRRANTALSNSNHPALLLPGDLEHAILAKVSTKTLNRLIDELGIAVTKDAEYTKHIAFMRKLGSKGATGKASSEPVKKPYMRGHMGRTIPAKEFSDDIFVVLHAWLKPVLPQDIIKKLLAKAW